MSLSADLCPPSSADRTSCTAGLHPPRFMARIHFPHSARDVSTDYGFCSLHTHVCVCVSEWVGDGGIHLYLVRTCMRTVNFFSPSLGPWRCILFSDAVWRASALSLSLMRLQHPATVAAAAGVAKWVTGWANGVRWHISHWSTKRLHHISTQPNSRSTFL